MHDKNFNLIVAVSGGVDSMVLLDKLCKEYPIENLHVVTVSHNVRINGHSDCLFVEDKCRLLNVKCTIVNVDAPKYAKENKLSIESSCRILRYRELDKFLLDTNYRIALAHHHDDNCETILMHIFRGCGVTGLVGIVDTNKYIHPILNMTRQEIINYANDNNIEFVIDDTNQDNKYNRNFIRNEIIPLISSRYPMANSLKTLSSNAKLIKEFINKSTPFDKVSVNNGQVTVLLDTNFDSIIIRNLITHAFSLLDKNADISRINLEDIESLLTKKVGSKICVSDNFIVKRTYDGIIISNNTTAINNDEIVSIPEFALEAGTFNVNGQTLTIEVIDNSKNLQQQITAKTDSNILYADYDKLPEGCIIRLRRDGDMFSKFKSSGKGKTKLKDYLIKQKIPLDKRNRLLVIAKDENVFVVINEQISQYVAVTHNTKRVLVVKIL